MSLEDKISNPVAPADLPGQRLEPARPAGKKRRRNGAKADSAQAKAKKSDIDVDDEAGGESTAVLTLGASDEERRPPKKMLFESASDGAALPFTGPVIRREALRTTAVAPVVSVANAPRLTPPEHEAAAATETPAAEKDETDTITSLDSAPEQEPASTLAPKSEANQADPLAAMKNPVFQVSSLATREPEPEAQPEPKDEAQPELPLMLTPVPAAVVEVPADVPMDQAAKVEQLFERSMARAFDTKRARDSAERSAQADEASAGQAAADKFTVEAEEAAVDEPIESLPIVAAPVPSPAPEAIAAKTQVPSAPVAATTPRPAETAYAAPVGVAPSVEPKAAESEPPTRGLSRSEAIARAARMSARAAPRPVPTAAETLAAARNAQQQMRSTELPKQPGDIYGYWTRVKNGRRFPSRADFDAEQVAENWPNSMLLTCSNGIGSHGNFSSVLRLDANRRSRPGDDLNFTSMITEWILATGGEAARAGAPVQDTEVFPTPDGTHAYKIVALPLSENQTRVDHVLCHLSRS